MLLLDLDVVTWLFQGVRKGRFMNVVSLKVVVVTIYYLPHSTIGVLSSVLQQNTIW